MKDQQLIEIVESHGLEQILIDAELTVETVALILHELGYVDLTIYEDEQ